MNSVFVPVHVAFILRRLAHVFSALSISEHYIFSQRTERKARLEERLGENVKGDELLRGAQGPAYSTPLHEVKESQPFPEQSARKAEIAETNTSTDHRRNTAARVNSIESSGTLPWTWRRLPWPSLRFYFAMDESTHTHSPDQGDYSPPPDLKPTKRVPDHPPPDPPRKVHEQEEKPKDIIHTLMANPALYDPVRAPRFPVVLCHGLYGFDVRGPASFPSLRINYWSNVLSILRKTVGADVIVTSVPPTGSIQSRAQQLHLQLCAKALGRGVNFLAHSMGGLDCRYLITRIEPKEEEYTPLSLTTVSTPHRGSPFMDWCAENIGIGKLRRQQEEQQKSNRSKDVHEYEAQLKSTSSSSPTDSPSSTAKSVKGDSSFGLSLSSLPSSLTTFLLSTLDSPAYANLTTQYLQNHFNPSTPDKPGVKYFSVASRTPALSPWHPLYVPKLVLDGAEERERQRWDGTGDARWGNDGLVTLQSARWGEDLGVLEGCDHWEMRGARGMEFDALGDNWDWGKITSVWRRQDADASKKSATARREAASHMSAGARVQAKDEQVKARERQRDREKADAVLKLSTDKLSAVFDWIVEQVPMPTSKGSPGKGDTVKAKEQRGEKVRKDKAESVNELASKEGLERFYVALCRKLYDEGL